MFRPPPITQFWNLTYRSRMYLYIIHFPVIVPPYILLTHYYGEEFFVRDVHIVQYISDFLSLYHY